MTREKLVPVEVDGHKFYLDPLLAEAAQEWTTAKRPGPSGQGPEADVNLGALVLANHRERIGVAASLANKRGLAKRKLREG